MDIELRDNILDAIYYDDLYVACYNEESVPVNNSFTGFLSDAMVCSYHSTLRLVFSDDNVEIDSPSYELQTENWPKRALDIVKEVAGDRYKDYELVHYFHGIDKEPEDEIIVESTDELFNYDGGYALIINFKY